ncbi:hypothetical protein T12_15224, partial [Trichinella patagoniensis]
LRLLLNNFGIKKTRKTPYHPQSDGLVERANRALLQLFRTYMVKDADWEDHLPLMLYAYRTAKHASTGASPFRKVGSFFAFIVSDQPLASAQTSK